MIDPETAAYYRQLPGDLGDRLRAALTEDEAGDCCFPLSDGDRCPFLDTDGLCEIHKQLGEAATSLTCREHPRFTEDYGPFREITLSASCPEANRLLLASDAPLTFRERETDDSIEEGDGWLPALLPLRKRLLDILRDRSHPLYERLRTFLALSLAAQERLEEAPDTLPASFFQNLRPGALPKMAGPGLFPDAFSVLRQLEPLNADWRPLLDRAAHTPKIAVPETALERIGCYMAFRYLLKCVNDGDLLSRAQLCVFAVLVTERLAAVCGLPEALRRLACEIGHSEENLDALLDTFWTVLPLESFFSELSVY